MKPTSAVLRIVAASCCLIGALFGQTGLAREESHRDIATPGNSSVDSAVPQKAELNHKQAPLVPILISATDASGNPTMGLGKDQLTIVDNNQVAQPVQLSKGTDVPLHLGIVLFSSPSSLGLYNSRHLEASFSEQKAAAIDFVKRTIRPNMDEAFVVTSGKTRLPPSDKFHWTQDPAELIRTIEGMNPDAGLSDLLSWSDEDAVDTIYQMQASDARPSRRVLVIFRTAWSHSPLYGTGQIAPIARRTEQMITLAQELHIATFVVGLEDRTFGAGTFDSSIGQSSASLPVRPIGGMNSPGGTPDREKDRELSLKYEAGKANLQRIAIETGGTTFWTTKKNCSDAVRAIANQLAGQYIVTFTPSNVPGAVHQLKVTSNSGARILAQTAFSY